MKAFPIVGGLAVIWSGNNGDKVQWKSGQEAYSTTERITPESEYVATGNAREYTITGLTPGTAYTVRVVNRVDATTVGSPSADVTHTAGSQQVFLTTDPEGGKLLVRWFPYSEASFYDVTAFSGSTQVFSDTFLDPATRSYTIDSLSAGTYTVKVQARDSNGALITTAGTFAEATGKVLLPPVTELYVVPASATSLKASWNAVSGAYDYEVQWRKEGQDWGASSRTATTALAALSHTITLDASNEKIDWYVRIRAKTTAGGESRWAYAEAKQGSLIPPTDLTVESSTSGRVTLDWTAPTWPVSKTLEHYFIDYWSGSLEDQDDKGGRSTTASENTATKATIHGLRPGTKYTFRVYAQFTDGMLTRFSNPVAATTAAATAAPNPPSSVTATASSQWYIGVFWVPDSASPGVTGYDVEFQTPQEGIWTPVPVFTRTIRNDDGEEVVVTVHDPPKSIQTIYGHAPLPEGAQYRYRVRAKNAIGDSAWTESGWVSTKRYDAIAFWYTFPDKQVPMYWHAFPTVTSLPLCNDAQADQIGDGLLNDGEVCDTLQTEIQPPPGQEGQERPTGQWATQAPFTMHMPGAHAPGPPGPHAYTPRAPGSAPVLLDDSETDALYDYKIFYPKTFLRYDEETRRLSSKLDGLFPSSVTVTYRATEKSNPQVSVSQTFNLTACSIAAPEGVTWPKPPYPACPVPDVTGDSDVTGDGGSNKDNTYVTSEGYFFSPPVFGNMLNVAGPAQSATVGTAFSYTAPEATDQNAGDTITYTAALEGGGALPAWLAFNAATRTFSGTPKAGDVTASALSVVMTATDDGKVPQSGTWTFSLSVSAAAKTEEPAVTGQANTAPSFDAGIVTTLSVDENSAAGTNVGSPITATDPDAGDTVTYSLTGTDAASFDIGSSTGQITTVANVEYNYEAKSSYSLSVKASDGKLSDSTPVTINLNDVAEAPTVADTTQFKTHAATVGTAFSLVLPAADANSGDGGPYKYLLWHKGAGKNLGTEAVNGLSFNAKTRTLSGTPAAAGTWELNYVVHDGDANTNAAADAFRERDKLKIVVAAAGQANGQGGSGPQQSNTEPANRAPVFDSGIATTLKVDENSPASTNVGKAITATDPDSGDTVTYSLTGTDAASFAIGSSSGQITTVSDVTYDFETKSSYSLAVDVSDGKGGTNSTPVTVKLNDVNEAPAFAEASTTLKIPENSAAATNVGSAITATDPDKDAALAYSLSGTDAASFAIGGSTGQITTIANVEYNYETKSSYSLTVDVSDGKLTDSIDVTVSLNNVNEAPAFADGTVTTLSVNENSAAGTKVGSVFTAADPDASDTLAYSLSGTDAASFVIGALTGQIATKSGVAYNHEAKSSYSLTVVATDAGGLTDSVAVTVSLNDVAEAPTVADTTQFKNHAATVGQTFSLTLPAADENSGDGGPYEYLLWHRGHGQNFMDQAINGLRFNAATRTLSGTPTAAGVWQLSYVVHDDDTDRSVEDRFRARTKLQITVSQ